MEAEDRHVIEQPLVHPFGKTEQGNYTISADEIHMYNKDYIQYNPADYTVNNLQI